MPNLNWSDAEDIGLALYESRPEVDPQTVRFTDMHQWITALDGFSDDPSKSNESKLEAIWTAWFEEWKDNQD